MRYFSVCVGLAIGNFVYQYFDAGNWSLAIDRSVFQTAAVAACWIATALAPAKCGGDQ